MSSIQIPNFNPPGRGVLAVVLGDAVDLTPIDQRLSYSYALPTKPGGSTATFSGAVFTPDVAGKYVATITAGADVLTVPVWAWAVSVYNGLAPSAGSAYSDAEKRAILSALSQGALTATQFTSWNSGTTPAGLNFLQWGGR